MQMVGMAVCQQDGIEFLYSKFQCLKAELRPGVYDNMRRLSDIGGTPVADIAGVF